MNTAYVRRRLRDLDNGETTNLYGVAVSRVLTPESDTYYTQYAGQQREHVSAVAVAEYIERAAKGAPENVAYAIAYGLRVPITPTPMTANMRGWVMSSIESYLEIEGYAPTLAEIGTDTGLSVPGVQRHVNALAREGKIKTLPGQHRNIRLAA